MEDEKALLTEAKGDNPVKREIAFTKLYNKYHNSVRYVIWNIVKNNDVTDDLLSVTFTKAFMKLDTYVNYMSFNMWLKKIASNTAIDFIRRTKQSSDDLYMDSDDSYFQLGATEPSPEQNMIQQQSIERTKEGLKKIRTKYRKIIEMRIAEKSYREISDTLNIPMGTVKSEFHKAKKALLKHIA